MARQRIFGNGLRQKAARIEQSISGNANEITNQVTQARVEAIKEMADFADMIEGRLDRFETIVEGGAEVAITKTQGGSLADLLGVFLSDEHVVFPLSITITPRKVASNNEKAN